MTIINNKADFERDIKNTANLAPILLQRTVTLTAAQIKSLVSTPVELVPAPGEGKFYDVQRVVLSYAPGSTPYTIPDQSTIGVGPSPSYADAVALFAASVLSPSALISIGVAAGTQWDASVLNAPVYVYLGNVTEELTDGDGTLTITVFYSVIDLG